MDGENSNKGSEDKEDKNEDKEDKKGCFVAAKTWFCHSQWIN